jgi:hypothetical protein
MEKEYADIPARNGHRKIAEEMHKDMWFFCRSQDKREIDIEDGCKGKTRRRTIHHRKDTDSTESGKNIINCP